MWHNEPAESIWPKDDREDRGSWWALVLALAVIVLGLAMTWAREGIHG